MASQVVVAHIERRYHLAVIRSTVECADCSPRFVSAKDTPEDIRSEWAALAM